MSDGSFQIEEYKALRVEIDNIQKQGYAIEAALTLGIASVIAFSIKEEKIEVINAFLLFIVTIVATAKKYFLSKRTKFTAQYIKLIEEKHKTDNLIGWEHYLTQHENSSWKNKGIATNVFYVLAFLVTYSFLLFSIYKTYC